jgi:hypothetical protein
MSHKLTKIVKWASVPTLLTAALFSSFAAKYEPLMDLLICMGAILLMQRAVWLKEYFWGAGMAAVVVVFSPLSLVVRILLLMGMTFVVSVAALLKTRRQEPVASL